MRKPDFCIYKNKGTDQLHGNYFLNPKFKPLNISCGCTARFVSDLVGNQEDRYSHDAAHIY